MPEVVRREQWHAGLGESGSEAVGAEPGEDLRRQRAVLPRHRRRDGGEDDRVDAIYENEP